MIIDEQAVNERRNLFFQKTRDRIPEVVNPADGSGRILQFNSPWREVLWIAPALYTGDKENIDLANRMIGRYFSSPPGVSNEVKAESNGKIFNVFLSTLSAGILAEFGPLLSPEAREVVAWHTEQVFKPFAGAAQPDLKFHGCNDNMPMMATKGLILGGQALGNEGAVRHGIWNLNEFRRLLSRSAWASEFNSSTYSPITLSNLAKIGEFAEDADVRQLARDCEARLWAEVLLHFHPGTRRSGGPSCRAYAVDLAGHPHSLQALLWLMFGPEISGCDLIESFFAPVPDPMQILHFGGNPMQNIAEMSDILSANFKIPPEIARLATGRSYPAVTRGRSESMVRYNGMAGEYHTVSYMEEEFSLGTVDTPLCNGDQTAQLYATYKLRPEIRSYRDSASLFYRCFTTPIEMSALHHSHDGGFRSEANTPGKGWHYTLQKDNAALMLSIVDPTEELTSGFIRQEVIFPAHYARIKQSIIGDGPVREGATGESEAVVPVSVEAGEVYIHIQPLLPTDYPRKAALRFLSEERYERLALINYEGEERKFSSEELGFMQNGFLLTIDAKRKWPSLEAFHRHYSQCRITDYTISNHRFFRYKRHGVSFEVCYTPAKFGVQTRAINGRNIELPMFATNQLDVAHFPFLSGEAEEDVPFFPWGDSVAMHNYPAPWLIGSRGEETPYSRVKGETESINAIPRR